VEEIEPDNESNKEDESKTSLGELWAIDAKTKTKTGLKLEEASHFNQQLHPVTIVSFPDKFGGHLVCTALNDQCCTGNGIITDNLANALRCEITKAKETTTYSTAGGDFISQYKISIKDAMLPCMLTTRTFDVVLNVMPKEASNATYGVIMGQDSMRALGIDTSVLLSTITWNDITIPMVPRWRDAIAVSQFR
jgi:hypothetical protein